MALVDEGLRKIDDFTARYDCAVVDFAPEDAAAPELMEAAREIEVEAAPEVAVVAEAAPAPEAVVEAAAPVVGGQHMNYYFSVSMWHWRGMVEMGQLLLDYPAAASAAVRPR